MMQAHDKCHVTADTAQPRKRSNVTRPFPSRGGIWVRDYTQFDLWPTGLRKTNKMAENEREQ